MKRILQALNQRKLYTLTLLCAFTLLHSSCQKDSPSVPEEPLEPVSVFAYEVDCNYCTISYTNANNETVILNNNMGKWNYTIKNNTSFDLKLKVTTLNSSYQSIQAYVLKDDEVVFGNVGYNLADIAYNPVSAKGTSSYGTYQSAVPSPGSGSGSTPTPSSSVCGAKNKTGGYCKRVVVGGGRCWQHR
jgi:hypothetical protein